MTYGAIEAYMANPAKFIREVRQETAKVTWPSRKETVQTTIMVFVMVTLIAIFFLAVDWVLGSLVQTILGFGR
jgi:preprotein translocase subunit SecE